MALGRRKERLMTNADNGTATGLAEHGILSRHEVRTDGNAVAVILQRVPAA